MSDASLLRLESELEKLSAAHSDLRDRLARLEGAGSPSLRDAVRVPSALRERVIEFLDQFRAGEALSELALGAWIAVCKDPELRGVLRTVQTREASHARLLGERIKELGGAASYELPETTYHQVIRGSASLEQSDADKVRAFVARHPDPVAALAPIRAIADRLDADRETQSLLRAIAQDELATLELFYAAAKRMAGGS